MELIEAFISETYKYDSKDEMVKHRAEMLNEGWEIDGVSFGEVLSITYTMEESYQDE